MKKLILLASLALSAYSPPAVITWLGLSTGYAYFGFTGFGQPGGPNIFTSASSSDGTTWAALAGSWSDYMTKPDSGTRVPYQMNAPDCVPIGGTIICHIATANDANINLVPWIVGTANATTGVITTTASIDWTGTIASVTACFAGGFARNTDMTVYAGDGNVHLYVPCSASGTAAFKVYETHASAADLTTWSTPVDTALNLANMIDPQVYFIGSTFYMWCKKDDTAVIDLATSSSATGTFTMVRTGDWAGWGTGLEGPFMYRPPNGVGWYLMFEAYTTTHLMYYSTCSTDDPTACTWSAKALWTEDRVYRHGAIIPLG